MSSRRVRLRPSRRLIRLVPLVLLVATPLTVTSLTRADASQGTSHCNSWKCTSSTTTSSPSTSTTTSTSTASTATSTSSTVTTTSTTSSASVPLSSTCSGVQLSPGMDIQSAINASPGGTTFCLAPGTYYLSQALTPISNDSLVAASPRAAVLDGQRTAVQAIVGYGGTTGQQHVTVTGLVIQNFADGATAAQSGALKAGWYWDIENNEIRYNNQGAQLGTGDTFKNNFVHHNAVWGFTGEGSGMLIDSNEVSYNNTSNTNFGYAGALKIQACSTCYDTFNVTLSNNYVHNNVGNGLWCDGCGSGIVFQNNTSVANQGSGIAYEIGTGATITGNTVTGNSTNCIGCSPWWGGDIAVNTSQNVNIYGNTVNATAGENGIALVGAVRSDAPAGGLSNISVQNNTFHVAGASDNGYVGSNDTLPISFNSNAWYVDSLTAPHWATFGGYPWTWSQWTSAGQDATGQLLQG